MPHTRRSIRLQNYDYNQPGAYFVTICTHERACRFGEIADGEMQLNEYGLTVVGCWEDLPNHYPHVELGAFVVMPNHVHGIIVLVEDAHVVGAGLRPAPTEPAPTTFAPTDGPAPTTRPKRHGLPEIVRAFKSFSARRINERRNTPGIPLWQRNYYERVIRSESELNSVRRYIANNLLRDAEDGET